MKKIFYLACIFAGMTGSTIFSMQKSTLHRRGETLAQATATAIGGGSGAYAGLSTGCKAGVYLTLSTFNGHLEQGIALSPLSCSAVALPACCCCGVLGAIAAYKASKQIQKAIEVDKKRR